jgi:hypothetical protein
VPLHSLTRINSTDGAQLHHRAFCIIDLTRS